MKRISYLLLGFLAAALLFEVALRLLPVFNGHLPLPVNDSNPVLRGQPNMQTLYNRDWNFRLNRHYQLNNYGFISDRDFHKGRQPLLLVGDSYVQGHAIGANSHLASRLSAQLGGTEVYSLGQSGAALSDYLGMASWGIAEFEPRAVMFLIVEGDLAESYWSKTGGYQLVCETADACRHKRVDWQPSQLPRTLAKVSSSFGYLMDNLALMRNFKLSSNPLEPGAAPAVKPGPGDRERVAADYFLEQVERQIGLRQAIFLINARPEKGQSPELDLFKQRAQARGFVTIDLDTPFAAERRKGERVDFMPVDAHWNDHAHLVASQQLLPVLKDLLNSGQAASLKVSRDAGSVSQAAGSTVPNLSQGRQ